MGPSDCQGRYWATLRTMLQAERTCTSSSFLKTPKTLPYLKQPIKMVVNSKKKDFSKHKKCKCTPLGSFYKSKEKLWQLTRHFIADYEDNLVLNIKDNPKRFWRYISAKDKSRQTISFLLNPERKKLEDKEDITYWTPPISHSTLLPG